MPEVLFEQASQSQVNLRRNRHEAAHARLLRNPTSNGERRLSRARLDDNPARRAVTPVIEELDERLGNGLGPRRNGGQLRERQAFPSRKIPGVLRRIRVIPIVQKSSHAPLPCNLVPAPFFAAIAVLASESAQFLRIELKLGC
jgi:hypothetical protein